MYVITVMQMNMAYASLHSTQWCTDQMRQCALVFFFYETFMFIMFCASEFTNYANFKRNFIGKLETVF